MFSELIFCFFKEILQTFFKTFFLQKSIQKFVKQLLLGTTSGVPLVIYHFFLDLLEVLSRIFSRIFLRNTFGIFARGNSIKDSFKRCKSRRLLFSLRCKNSSTLFLLRFFQIFLIGFLKKFRNFSGSF